MKSSARTMLRWGIAFTFFYAAVASLRAPENWVGYLPPFLAHALPPRVLLAVFSVYELGLAGWLFTGKAAKWAALLSFLTLAGITAMNLSIFDVTFRDVGLAVAALALFIAERGASEFPEGGFPPR